MLEKWLCCQYSLQVQERAFRSSNCCWCPFQPRQNLWWQIQWFNCIFTEDFVSKKRCCSPVASASILTSTFNVKLVLEQLSSYFKRSVMASSCVCLSSFSVAIINWSTCFDTTLVQHGLYEEEIDWTLCIWLYRLLWAMNFKGCSWYHWLCHIVLSTCWQVK